MLKHCNNGYRTGRCTGNRASQTSANITEKLGQERHYNYSFQHGWWAGLSMW